MVKSINHYMKKGVNIVITNNQGKILILERSSSEFNYPNFWDLPGGKVENDETLQEAVKREVKEESGLDIEQEQNYFYVHHCQDKEVDIYGFKANLISGDVIISEEHTKFRWISENEWKNLKYTPSVRATIEEFFKQ